MWKLDGKSDGEGSLELVQISRSLNFEVDFKRITGSLTCWQCNPEMDALRLKHL